MEFACNWCNAHFSASGQYLSNFSFCHIHIQKPFFYLLLSLTKAKYKLLRQSKPSLTSVSIYLVTSAQSPLLWALISQCKLAIQIWLYLSIYETKTQLLYFISSEPQRLSLHLMFVFTLGCLLLLKLHHNN